MSANNSGKWTGYYTKDQLVALFRDWSIAEPIPGKNKKVLVAFPPGSQFAVGTITRHDKPSTYGKTLFRVELAQTLAP